MAKSDGPNFIDGFSSVQAVRRSRTAGQGVKTQPSRSKLRAVETPAQEKKPDGSRAKKISHSVMPDKFSITCYECEYNFTMQGRVIDTFCPKCHKKLEAKNVTISNEWSQDIRTIGKVEIQKGAVVKDCKIVTRDLLLAGDASEARLLVYNKLELSGGAGFNMDETVIRTLVAVKNSRISLKGKIACETLEVFGTIRVDVTASARVIVEKDGFLKGNIAAPSLVVYEGAGLKAKLKIGAGRK